ncbi:MAG: hypothetical protein VR68_10740 [Peptococcaceae bacterium BRH_c4a]|nr:MAG: hypothetical protein VR68_10740 [Peptococcaceae bacterium BRH_c4a]
MYGGGEWLAKNWPGPDYWTAGIKGASVPVLSLKYPSVLTFILLFAPVGKLPTTAAYGFLLKALPAALSYMSEITDALKTDSHS